MTTDGTVQLLSDLMAVREHLSQLQATISDLTHRLAENEGKDATAFCGEDVAVYCASCGAREIAPDVYAHTPSCVLSARAVAPPPRPRSVAHATEPMPNAALHDEPPSRPL